MGYKRVIIHVDDTRKLIGKRDWTTYKHINEYIEDMAKFGLRPYKKDIKPSLTGSGIGEPKMNHFCVKNKMDDGLHELNYDRFKYIIIDKRKWMLTKIQYGI